MGFSGYFLIVQDFINWAKINGIRVGPGRGSGAGSLVAYALRITDIDPLPYNLLFERFLNPDRVSMPDFDIDFMQERRGEVIQYVANRYGRDHVGQIATYSALNPKSAVKDVARTLGIPFSEINELTKPMPLLVDGKKPDLDQALEFAPKLKAKALEDPVYKRILATARTLEGLYRQVGMHAAGVVISEKPLVEYVPVFAGQNGELITQFDKDKVEDAGLVKFDFLGLKTLDVIAQAENLINLRIGTENQLDNTEKRLARDKHPHAQKSEGEIPFLKVELLSPDAPEVYQLIASGDTLGIFQVESTGFQELCRKLKPDCFEDIIAAGALYRPGPMQSGMVDDFVDRKHGRQKIIYPHPLLETVLKPTYGTIVYQEQVLLSAQVLAGYSLGAADLLRRAMGKKKFEEMQQQRNQFMEGAKKNGVDPEQAGQVFDSIEKFAGYGFNKSHAAAYAMITYQTAYLKRFYPVEFMAALLTTSSGSTEDVVKYIYEAKISHIEVLPPDVNISLRKFTVDYSKQNSRYKNGYGSIRFGLEAVKGLGDAALETLLEARGKEKEFRSIFHFCESTASQKINKRVLEALVKSGAMDGFNKPRKQLFAAIEKALSNANSLQKDAAVGQSNLFDMASLVQESKESYVDVGEWSEKERLANERDSLGFYSSGHPLDRYVEDARKLGAIATVEIPQKRHLEVVQIAGMVIELKERMLKSGNGRWAIVRVEDTFGHAEVLAFSKSYQDHEAILRSGEPILIKGRVLHDDIDDEGKQSTAKMRLESALLLSVAQTERTRFVDIKIASSSADEYLLEQIHKLCERHKGEKPLRIILERAKAYSTFIVCGENTRVDPNDEFIAELEAMPGILKATRI